MPTRDEILAKVRSKYPAYKDVPDDKLADALSKKYPVYAQYLNQPDQLSQKFQEQGLMGGTGQPMSKEDAKAESMRRLVAKDPERLMLVNEGTPEMNVAVKGQGFVPRALAATVGGGFTSGPARILQDLMLKAKLASPEVADAMGIERVAQENPGTTLAGNLIGSLAPAGKFAQATSTLGRIATGAGLGATYGASESIGREGVNKTIENPETLLANTGKGAAFGAAIPAGLEGILLASRASKYLSDQLRASAEKNVSKALSPTTKELKLKTEKITPEILSRPAKETYAFTKKGLEEKASLQKDLAGEAIEALGELKGTANPQQVVQSLEKLKAPYVVEGKVINPEAIQRIEGVQEVFNQFGDSISAEGLRTIRRTFDKEINASKGFFKDVNQGSMLELKKTAANEIREILAKDNPDLAALNKQYNFWSNLEDVISKTNERVKPQSSLTGNIAGIAGAVSGSTPEGMIGRFILGKAIVSAARSPGWNLLSAKIKDTAAKALATGEKALVSESIKALTGQPMERFAFRALSDISHKEDEVNPAPLR
jgi:hypothetical protein